MRFLPDDEVVGVAVLAPGVVELMPADAVPSARGGRVRVEQGPLGPDEVAGRTVCTLVSPGTEIAGAFRPAGASVPYPWIPGYAAVFEVDAVGDAVTDVAVGDLVFSQGSHRSRQRERAAAVWPLPEGLDPFEAVFARLMAVPMTALATTTARPGASVGVSGLGPVGHLAAAIFALCGYQVTAWDPREDRRAQAPSTAALLDRAPEPVPRAQHGTTHGFDLILECSGHDGAALAAVRAVRSGGEVVLVGAPWARRTEASAHDLLTEVFHRYVSLRSGWEWQVPSEPPPFGGPSVRSNIEQALRWLRDGDISVAGLADRFPPGEAAAVYASLADGRTQRLRALFDWRAPAR